jgi:hypothetical protein
MATKTLYSRVNMGVVVDFQITKTILLEAYGGISAARKYRFEDASKQFFNYNSNTGGFFSIGVIFTPSSKAAENSKVDN